MRKHGHFAEGEYYHVYNRGVDKRDITMDWKDSERFLQSIIEFNTVKPIGSIYENNFKNRSELGPPRAKLVDIVAFCLNPNHYHMLLTPLTEQGIEKFMQKFGAGFTLYFNEKYERTGALFQGRFKSSHIDSNEYLLHVAAYINLNDKVHQLGPPRPKLVRNSWDEYLGKSKRNMCNKEIILGQFKNSSKYKKSTLESLKYTLANRYSEESLVIDLLSKEEYPKMFPKQKLPNLGLGGPS